MTKMLFPFSKFLHLSSERLVSLNLAEHLFRLLIDSYIRAHIDDLFLNDEVGALLVQGKDKGRRLWNVFEHYFVPIGKIRDRGK